MPKYKLKSLSFTIGGKRFKKEEGEIFDTESKKYKPVATELKAAFAAGFLEEIKETKKTQPPKNNEKTNKK